jgi:hypothetical protein
MILIHAVITALFLACIYLGCAVSAKDFNPLHWGGEAIVLIILYALTVVVWVVGLRRKP